MSERQLLRIEQGKSPARRVVLVALADLYEVAVEDLEEEEVAA